MSKHTGRRHGEPITRLKVEASATTPGGSAVDIGEQVAALATEQHLDLTPPEGVYITRHPCGESKFCGAP